LKRRKKTTPKQEIAIVWFPSVKQAWALTDSIASTTVVVLPAYANWIAISVCTLEYAIAKKSFGQTIYGAQPFSPKGLPRVRRVKAQL